MMAVRYLYSRTNYEDRDARELYDYVEIRCIECGQDIGMNGFQDEWWKYPEVEYYMGISRITGYWMADFLGRDTDHGKAVLDAIRSRPHCHVCGAKPWP